MKAIILVGGFGTRLRPLTLNKPKPLLPVLNQPFLSYQLSLLKRGGVKEIVFAVGAQVSHWGRELKKITPNGIKVLVSVEKKPMGTGGAVRLGLKKWRFLKKMDPHEPIVVLNGDVFLDLDVKRFHDFHRSKKSMGTVALHWVKDCSRFGFVQHNKELKILKFSEKPKRVFPGFINAGAYILSVSFIKKIPNRPCSIEREVFPKALQSHIPMYGFRLKGYWNDIGTPESYLKAHQDLLLQNKSWTDNQYFRKREGRKTSFPPRGLMEPRKGSHLIAKGAQIGKKVQFRGFSCIGPKVKIGDHSLVENSVLHAGVILGKGVVIENSLIGEKARLGDFVKVRSGSVIGPSTHLTDYSKS